MMPESSNSETKTMNMIEAINSAMDVMLARDPNTVVMGEDVGFFGGVFRATAGLQKKHGKTRVFDTPINESGIIGVAGGMGAYGLDRQSVVMGQRVSVRVNIGGRRV